jgi:hypothetical protein
LLTLRAACGIVVHDQEEELSWLKKIWKKLHVPSPNPDNFKVVGFETPLSKYLRSQNERKQVSS